MLYPMPREASHQAMFHPGMIRRDYGSLGSTGGSVQECEIDPTTVPVRDGDVNDSTLLFHSNVDNPAPLAASTLPTRLFGGCPIARESKSVWFNNAGAEVLLLRIYYTFHHDCPFDQGIVTCSCAFGSFRVFARYKWVKWDDFADRTTYPRFCLPFVGGFKNLAWSERRSQGGQPRFELQRQIDDPNPPRPSLESGDAFDREGHEKVDFGEWPYRELKLKDARHWWQTAFEEDG